MEKKDNSKILHQFYLSTNYACTYSWPVDEEKGPSAAVALSHCTQVVNVPQHLVRWVDTEDPYKRFDVHTSLSTQAQVHHKSAAHPHEEENLT